MNGILVVNKERGYSSFDVIAVLRGVLGMKKLGHTGTLDPEAEGVLPVCLGYATKICDYLMAQKKEYIAHGKLGIVTDTQDIFGAVLEERPFCVSKEQLGKTLKSFVGTIEQLTPMYSARKIDGVKLVDLARKGISVERSKKTVQIYDAELLSYEETTGEYVIRILCQKGTYIRTICNDLGEKLGCGSCMTALTRTKTGQFTVENSYTIAQIRELRESGRLAEAIIPIDAMYLGCAPMELAPDYRTSIRNGNFLEPEWLTPCDEPVPESFQSIYENLLGEEESRCIRVYLDGEFYAVYRKRGKKYRPLQMYHEVDNEKNHQKKLTGCCLSIGKFDGLHLGHRRLIAEMSKSTLPKILLSVTAPGGKCIFTQEETGSIAQSLSVDRTDVWELTEERRKMSPEEFAGNILVDTYHARKIVVGEDFRFGRDQTGDAAFLKRFAEENGMECVVCPTVCTDGEPVSSSRIRTLLSEGNIEEVNRLLGTPYFIEGEILRGKQIGRTLGFPTINLCPGEDKLLPLYGVYRTETKVCGKIYPSVTNIGDNPTVEDGMPHQTTVETHIIGFSGDIYGETARVTFLKRLRDQIHFPSLEALKEQLSADIAEVLEKSAKNG